MFISMNNTKKFIITKHYYGNIVIMLNGSVFYTAKNRVLYAAIDECKAFLSSWPSIPFDIDPELAAKYNAKKKDDK